MAWSEGCYPVCSKNINALISTVNNLATNNDALTNEFIGDTATINAQAIKEMRKGITYTRSYETLVL